MSVTIKIEHAKKKYGETTIINDLSLTIKEGELFTLLGPSGCGKTTLLRMIAGFNSIEGGSFYFNDQCINELAPAKRNIGIVFQNYAIFPHLSVEENIQFGLKTRKLSKAKIIHDSDEILALMQIEPFKTRMPEKLSGGQQQRVALARAIVIRPDVLLMDEPLSNLDAKLRVDMRTVIRDIQKEVGITTVYVTHDQEEAMSISDRIAVMKDGDILHLGTPRNIYQRPASLFVATFIGRTNILKGFLTMGDQSTIEVDGVFKKAIHHIRDHTKSQSVQVSIRPEEMSITQNGDFEATILSEMFLGINTHYILRLSNDQVIEIFEESDIDTHHQIGDLVSIAIKVAKINVFDESGRHNLVTGVVNDYED